MEVGQHTQAASDKNQRCAIVLRAESREEILARIEDIKEMLKIKVRTDDGEIQGPIWE